MRYDASSRRFVQGEDGGGTIFALFLFVVMAMILGLALDGSNGWRNQTMLASAADTGSHAGAVALASGASPTDIVAASRAQVYSNMPTSIFGYTVGGVEDVVLMHYDLDTGQLSTAGPTNAVAVRTSRLAERGNPMATYLLNFAGVTSFDIREVSAAIYDVSTECEGTDGIYSEAQIRASSQNYFGTGYCVHSNDRVWLPQQNTFADDTLVSMPDLADCGNKCNEDANPGINATELNMIFPDFGQWIDDTYDDFADTGLPPGSMKDEFFSTRPVGDLAPLYDAGVLTPGYVPMRGDVITMSQSEFQSIETLPSGLVYEIGCPLSGNGPTTSLEFSGTAGKIEDGAILTSCSLDFKDGSVVEGSLIVTTRDSSSATVGGEENVQIGDSSPGTCNSDDRSTIMSKSGAQFPAKMAASNVTFIVDDTVNIASSSFSGDTSYGLTIYATDEVRIASQHTFISCGPSDEILVPRGKIIRHVATN